MKIFRWIRDRWMYANNWIFYFGKPPKGTNMYERPRFYRGL
jgi:hypothetical protein